MSSFLRLNYLFVLGRFDVEDLDPFLCTHLMFGFAGLHPTKHTIMSLGILVRTIMSLGILENIQISDRNFYQIYLQIKISFPIVKIQVIF